MPCVRRERRVQMLASLQRVHVCTHTVSPVRSGSVAMTALVGVVLVATAMVHHGPPWNMHGVILKQPAQK